MAIIGLRHTGNFVADQRATNWREGIVLSQMNGKVPLVGFTSAMKSDSTDDPRFSWWEKMLSSRRVALGANVLVGDTVLTVLSGAQQFKLGDILLVEHTQELVKVSASPSADTSLTVTRGFAGSTATAVTFAGAGVNPNLICVGSAYEEGSNAPDGVNFDPSARYNFTQIFRNTLEATRTAIKTRLRTGEQVKEAKREALEMHTMDMERAFLFGRKIETTQNGRPLRTTDGVLSVIPAANKVACDTTNGVTFGDLESYMERMFRFGSSEKVAFCGNAAALAIQQIVRSAKGVQWTFNGGSEFGMDVTRLTSPFGTLVLKTHPLLNYMSGGTTGGTAYYGHNGSLIVLDMEQIQYRYLTDSDTKYNGEMTTPGVDGMKGGFLTEAGLQIGMPDHHFLLTNLVKAKAE